jgi:hypothetical protein
VVAPPLCWLVACRWVIVSVAGLESAEAIAREGLTVWQAKAGGLGGLYTIAVRVFPT